ncbi:hypothetical protein SAMN02745975_01003 [Geosporobacter subterraneus DSM 17957]|uniref:Cyclic GMP-AMP synthase n=1 Tax=Geosporobacter subterraneus DSM 17957 TaxID=1121919 RepID=A0A1M6FGY8_9FIRM|nr:hypothetical protein SAMN02745975_01003 [Geosporobacter subterraneus DSM 17957]
MPSIAKKGNLGTEPEAKTNCVRIKYSNGYHVDFAVYRRTLNSDGTYSYEHGGSAWQSRDPKAISNWFSDQIRSKRAKLCKGAFDVNAVNFSNTEEFIEDEVNVNEIYEVKIDCEASGNGFRTGPISVYIDKVLKSFCPIILCSHRPY